MSESIFQEFFDGLYALCLNDEPELTRDELMERLHWIITEHKDEIMELLNDKSDGI